MLYINLLYRYYIMIFNYMYIFLFKYIGFYQCKEQSLYNFRNRNCVNGYVFFFYLFITIFPSSSLYDESEPGGEHHVQQEVDGAVADQQQRSWRYFINKN